MAISFPIPQNQLGDLLPVQVVDWNLETYQELSMQGNAEFLAADLASPLWTGNVTLRPLLHTDARAWMARLNALDGSIYPFYLANPLGWWPKADPGGSATTGLTPTINTINANRKELTFAGLVDGYVISPGDFFSVSYASGARRALFQCVTGATAGGSGTTASIEVRPHIQAGISAGASVSFAKPAAKVKIVPGTLTSQFYNANRTRINFSVRQTLQAD